MVVESVRRLAAMAMSAMMTTATIAITVQVVGYIVEVEVFVVVVVDELVVALVSGAWFCVCVVVDDEELSVVAETAGSASATIKAGMRISLRNLLCQLVCEKSISGSVVR